MNITRLFALVVLTFIFSQCAEDEPLDLDVLLTEAIKDVNSAGVSGFILPDQYDFDNIPQEPKNPLNEHKVELGRNLFYETGLATLSKHESGRGTYSCGTCHLPELGMLPGYHQGIADGGNGYQIRSINEDYLESDLDVQAIRPMSLYNVGFMTNTLWNGRFGARDANVGTEHVWGDDGLSHTNELGYSGLECQNIEGLKLHRMEVTKPLMETLGYTELFDLAFPEFSTTTRYTLLTGSFALSAYLRTMTTSEAPFQKWLKGDKEILTDQQKEGAILFFSKARCVVCHNGPAFSSNRFFALGVNDMDQRSDAVNNIGPELDRNGGRGAFTQEDEDLYKFKVPQLYNLKGNEHFFHGSSKSSIVDVIKYKSLAEYENQRVEDSRKPNEFQTLNLSDDEIAQLADFIENGLYDPTVLKFKPTSIISGNCFPNADELSIEQLDCD